MCHISLKFQDKNYFFRTLEINTLMIWVQRNKGLSKNRLKIEISIKNFGYSVKFDVRKKRKKINGLYRNDILLPRLEFDKFWSTAMAGGATDLKVTIVAKSCVYRENVLDEK